MAKKKAAKKTEKKRSDKYEKKVAINATFSDVIKLAVGSEKKNK